MNILALDTSTESCSAALSIAGRISERFEIAQRRHSALILPMLDGLLSEAGLGLAQIDAIAFGCGPGSFTGVRIAASITQGIAFGAGLPVVPVSSLAALAQGIYRTSHVQCVLAAIDARMGEVYWGAYQCDDRHMMVLQGSEGVYPPKQVPIPIGDEKWVGAGSGWASYGPILQSRLSSQLSHYQANCYPLAYDVATLGAELFKQGLAVSAELALPVYIRNEVAWKKTTSP